MDPVTTMAAVVAATMAAVMERIIHGLTEPPSEATPEPGPRRNGVEGYDPLDRDIERWQPPMQMAGVLVLDGLKHRRTKDTDNAEAGS